MKKFISMMIISALILTVSFGVVAATVPTIANFTDVSANDWFFRYAEFAIERGLFDGVSDSEFAPNEPITRAMFVTALWRLAGEPSATWYSEAVDLLNAMSPLGASQPLANPFADVAAYNWYAAAITWAEANELVFGVTETIFEPNSEITREQMATIVYRYQRFSGTVQPDVVENIEFSDWYDTSPSGKEGVMRVVTQGIMRGHFDGRFAPRGLVTRVEAAAVMMRLANEVE